MILECARLRIMPLRRTLLKLLLEGMPCLERELGLNPSGGGLDEHTHAAMTYLYDLAGKTPSPYPWITNWQIILKEENVSAGSLCFMSLPDADGSVEVGYGMGREFRNRGLMTEALRCVCSWALLQPGVKRIVAESEPENAASHRVLEKCGFRRVSARSWLKGES